MIVQPCSSRVMGTRFLVRLSVTRANSPLGMPGDALQQIGRRHHHAVVDDRPRSVSITVTSDIDGVRN